MIEQQIKQFTNSLQNIATEYSDPAVILQHMPVLKDFPLLQQNPEFLGYGVSGIFGLLILLRILRKRRKSRVKNIAMVMPQPYLGEPDHAQSGETAPASFDKEETQPRAQAKGGERLRIAKQDVEPRVVIEPAPRPRAEPTTRGPAQQLEDVNAISFSARAAMTPDEARMRVLVQAVLNEFGAGYMIMARTALSALLEPCHAAVGPERANAIAAVENKFLDFGIFDRAGRCILALDVTSSATPAVGNKALERAVVQNALSQAGLPLAKLTSQDTPAEVRSKIAGFLKPSAQGQVPAAPRSVALQAKTPARPGRPTRPVRPAHAAAIAAE